MLRLNLIIMKKNFLFLLGTQKAGSTYTAMLLKKHPNVWMGGIKEMRYWKNYFRGDKKKKILIRKFEANKNLRIIAENLKDNDFSTYFSRYSNLENNNDIKCVADMTPSHGTLNEKQLSIAYEAILNNGYNIKPVYLMRDPIERLWSQTKMHYFNKIMHREQKNIDKIRLFDLFLSLSIKDFNNKDSGRTRYDLILPKIKKVFYDENIFYYFSEHMREETFKFELYNYLGLDNFVSNKNKIASNPGDILISSDEIPKTHLDQVLGIFKPVYMYIYDSFKEKTPKIWQERIKNF